MRKKRPQPLWYLILSNTVPIICALCLCGLVLLLYRMAVYLLGGPRLWF